MSITSIDSSSILANSVAFTTASPTAACKQFFVRSGVSGHHHHPRGGSEPFMQEVKQALSGSESTCRRSSPPPQARAKMIRTPRRATAARLLEHKRFADIHKLMHDLFAALHRHRRKLRAAPARTATGITTTPHISTKAAGYANLTTGLQNLIQQLGSGTTATNDPLSALQTDFQRSENYKP